MPETLEPFQLLLDLVRRRKTEKVMALEPRSSAEAGPEVIARAEEDLAESLRAAGWAPFHYDRGVDGVPEPWRVHWIQRGRCRALAAKLPQLIPDLKPGNRLAALLEACGSLVLVNWLPESLSRNNDSEKLRSRDDEHLAAAAAFVQNLLLLTTAAGLGTFWSSGTLLRGAPVQAELGIPENERLLAALFVDYTPFATGRAVERIPGALREKRSDWSAWCRVIN